MTKIVIVEIFWLQYISHLCTDFQDFLHQSKLDYILISPVTYVKNLEITKVMINLTFFWLYANVYFCVAVNEFRILYMQYKNTQAYTCTVQGGNIYVYVYLSGIQCVYVLMHMYVCVNVYINMRVILTSDGKLLYMLLLLLLHKTTITLFYMFREKQAHFSFWKIFFSFCFITYLPTTLYHS